MRTGLRSLIVLVTVQLFLDCPRGTPLKPNHAPGLRHDHLLAHMLQANKAHMMSKLKQTAIPHDSVSPGINMGINNAIHSKEPNTVFMEAIHKDLKHIPDVVSVSIGTPGKTRANSPWDVAANGVAFPNSESSFNNLGSHEFSGDINPFTHSNNDHFSTSDTFSDINNPIVTSSVSNGVQVIQTTLNGGGNLYELVLPDNQFVNKTDVVTLESRSEEIPNKDAFLADNNFAILNALTLDNQVDKLQHSVYPVDEFLTGLTNLVPINQETGLSSGPAVNVVPDFNHAVNVVPDFNHAVNVVPDSKHTVNVLPDFNHAVNMVPDLKHSMDLVPVSQKVTNTQDFPIAPSALTPATLLSLENAYRLIPAIGKTRDFNSKMTTNQHSILLADTGHIQNVNNSSGLQIVAVGLGNIDISHVPDAQVRTYNPFSTRLKPEAFGPGPYYECAPPSEVVCGARIGWHEVIGMSVWCKENCIVFNYSSYCDDDRCKCECVAPAV